MTNARRRCLATAFALLVAAVPSVADTVVDKKVTYFDIGGRTADELDDELQRRGPYTTGSGTRHPGATKIKFGGEVTYAQHAGRCSIQSVRVRIGIQIVLPRWVNRKRAPADMALIWDTLSRDIKRHEERHAEIARQHGTALDRSLRGLRPARNCADLQLQVDELSRESLVAHDADQARFDRIEAANFESRLIRLLESSLRRRKP